MTRISKTSCALVLLIASLMIVTSVAATNTHATVPTSGSPNAMMSLDLPPRFQSPGCFTTIGQAVLHRVCSVW